MTAHTLQTQQCGLSDDFFFGDVCLLGLGVTGRAVCAFFEAHPDSFKTLTVYGAGEAEKAAFESQNLSDKIAILPDQTEVSGVFDLAVVSPGFAPHHTLYVSAQKCSRELIGEPELAWRVSPSRWVGITGTNGKTTTTTLVADLLNAGGIKARAIGNIGTPCIEAVCNRAQDEYLVTELSSYQLYSMVDFAPDAAILLAITPDHLSWHGSHEAYIQAKRKLLDKLGIMSPLVIDAAEETTRMLLRTYRDEGKRTIGVGTADGIYSSMVARCGAQEAAYVAPDSHILTVVLDGVTHELCHTADMNLRGAHNYTNALAAATVALALGVAPKKVKQTLIDFKPPEHRFELCGEVEGIRFYNDSKATNTDSTIKAVEAFDDDEDRRVILLLGGRDKGTDLADLVAAASRSCRDVICFGEAGARFYEAFSSCDAFTTSLVSCFADACQAAWDRACEGDVILLSPACASFDEFEGFEARGAAFKKFAAAPHTAAQALLRENAQK